MNCNPCLPYEITNQVCTARRFLQREWHNYFKIDSPIIMSVWKGLSLVDHLSLNQIILEAHKCTLTFKRLPWDLSNHSLWSLIPSQPNLQKLPDTICFLIRFYGNHLESRAYRCWGWGCRAFECGPLLLTTDIGPFILYTVLFSREARSNDPFYPNHTRTKMRSVVMSQQIVLHFAREKGTYEGKLTGVKTLNHAY